MGGILDVSVLLRLDGSVSLRPDGWNQSVCFFVLHLFHTTYTVHVE